MAKRPPPKDPKEEALRSTGTLYGNASEVSDDLFLAGEFFDRRDLLQVKYEMLRRVRVDGQPVSRAASAFSFSRPSWYQAQSELEQGGLAALIPRKRGPKGPRKLSPEILDFLLELTTGDPTAVPTDLVSLVQERFGVSVHPRTIERGLKKKKRL